MTTSRPRSAEQREALREAALESAELVVERDANGLERARRGMNAARSVPARMRRDESRELPRRRQRRRRARAHDRGCDLPRARLLAVAEQHVGELVLRRRRASHSAAVGPLRSVHPHVQGSVVREAETALRLIQLRRGDPEVEEDPGEAAFAEPWCRDGAKIFEAGVLDAESRVGPEPLASVSHRVRVFVQSE